MDLKFFALNTHTHTHTVLHDCETKNCVSSLRLSTAQPVPQTVPRDAHFLGLTLVAPLPQ